METESFKVCGDVFNDWSAAVTAAVTLAAALGAVVVIWSFRAGNWVRYCDVTAGGNLFGRIGHRN